MQVIIVEGILALHFRSMQHRAHMKVFVDRCAAAPHRRRHAQQSLQTRVGASP
jgi:uridine kinase